MAKEYAVRFYNSKAWLKCRESYIQSVDGLCERCLSEGRYTTGWIVHHKTYITPYNINNPDITLNWDNLEYLCQDCHNKEHHGSNGGVIEEGCEFDEDGMIVKI